MHVKQMILLERRWHSKKENVTENTSPSAKKSIVQELIQNKLQLFGHVEGMTVEK